MLFWFWVVPCDTFSDDGFLIKPNSIIQNSGKLNLQDIRLVINIIPESFRNINISQPMTFIVNLPDQYGYVLLSACVMGFSILVVGFLFAGRARGKVFTEEYMKQNFGAEHLKSTGNEIKAGGYPDTGSGFYSRNLTYQQWYELNNGQRAHMNYVEWIASCLVFLLIAGLYFPIPAASVGLGITISRFIYAYGYTSGGPTGRSIGALLNDLLVLAEFILAIISSAYFISGKALTG